jgi:hypothetical protein
MDLMKRSTKVRVTLKQINDRIATYGFVLEKGNGYFWFFQWKDLYPPLKNASVMVNTLSQLTVDQWEQELLDRIRWKRWTE